MILIDSSIHLKIISLFFLCLSCNLFSEAIAFGLGASITKDTMRADSATELSAASAKNLRIVVTLSFSSSMNKDAFKVASSYTDGTRNYFLNGSKTTKTK